MNNIPNEKNSFVEKLHFSATSMKELYSESREILADYEAILIDIESQLEDELHFIEFNVLNAEESVKFSWKLHELRKKRRYLKDAIYAANLFNQTFLSMNCFEHLSSKLEGLSHRNYHLRSPEHFEH